MPFSSDRLGTLRPSTQASAGRASPAAADRPDARGPASRAAFALSCPHPNPDALLLLADALDEAAAAAMPPALDARAPLIRYEARALAEELRRRAPEYAR